MSLMDNLLLWGCVVWVPWLIYFLLRNEAKPKKNIIVGVTLPPESHEEEAVQAIIHAYKRELLWITILSMLPVIPCLFIESFGISFTVFMFWTIGICFVGYIPYVRCNKALHRLKEDRGWKKRGSGMVQVDLKAAAAEMKWLSPLLFVPPVLLSLIPMFFDWELWPLWITMSVTVVLFYVCYRYCYRNKAEMVDANTERTVALTRIRRYNWGKTWLIMAWATGILNPLIWLTQDSIWWSTAVFLGYMLVVIWAALGIEFRVRTLQEKLCADSAGDSYVDEDDYWIWGMFYYNPNDSRLIINNRVGMNTSINMAKRSGQILTGGGVLLLCGCMFIGVGVMGMERTPVELSVTDTVLVGSHYFTEYEVPLDEIERIELLEELPAMQRVVGTGMPGLCSGTWNSKEWGRFTCCIDPREGPWILVELESGKTYLLGGGEDNTVEQIFSELAR